MSRTNKNLSRARSRKVQRIKLNRRVTKSAVYFAGYNKDDNVRMVVHAIDPTNPDRVIAGKGYPTDGLSWQVIALEASDVSLECALKACGAGRPEETKSRGNRTSDSDRAEVLRLTDNGCSRRFIAQKLGISERTVSYVRAEAA